MVQGEREQTIVTIALPHYCHTITMVLVTILYHYHGIINYITIAMATFFLFIYHNFLCHEASLHHTVFCQGDRENYST